MKINWKEIDTKDKILMIIRTIASIGVIVTAILYLTDILEYAIYLPLMGITLLAQSIQEWKRTRWLAIFSLCASMFIFLCTYIVLFVK